MEYKKTNLNGFKNQSDFELFWFRWALYMSTLNKAKGNKNREYVERKLKEWNS